MDRLGGCCATIGVMVVGRRGVVQCGAAAVFFGATTPFASGLADDMNAGTLAGLLYVGAAIAVAPTVLRRGRPGSVLARGGRPLVIAVVAGGLVGPVLLTAGLARTSAATASLLLNFELVATTVLAAVFFGEHIGRRVAGGATLVVAAGVTLTSTDAPDLRAGAVLIVAACIAWGLDNCVTADLDTVAPSEITLAKGAVAGTTNLALGLALASAAPALLDAISAVALGAVGYGASITLWVRGARELGAARAQLIFSTGPFVGVVISWVVLGETATLAELIATGLAAAGVLLVLGSGHEHPHAHGPIEHEHEHDHDDHHQHHHEMPPGRHTHRHRHEPLVHAHPHVPDLHHRHEHPTH